MPLRKGFSAKSRSKDAASSAAERMEANITESYSGLQANANAGAERRKTLANKFFKAKGGPLVGSTLRALSTKGRTRKAALTAMATAISRGLPSNHLPSSSSLRIVVIRSRRPVGRKHERRRAAIQAGGGMRPSCPRSSRASMTMGGREACRIRARIVRTAATSCRG